MRRILFWFGVAVLIALPFAYGTEIYITQDLPGVAVWKWGVLGAAVILIFLARSRDDVLKHHLG